MREHPPGDGLRTLTGPECARTSRVEASGPTKPLTFRESVIFGFGNLGSNAVYNFLNGAAGLYLIRYPEVPVWLVGLLAQERSLAGAVAQPIVGAMSDRTRTRIGRRKPYFIAGVALTAASLLYLSGFPPLVPMLIGLSINACFLNVAVDPYTALLADIVPPGQRGRVGTVLPAPMLGQIAARSRDLPLDRHQIVVVCDAILGPFTTTIGVREPDRLRPQRARSDRRGQSARVSGARAHNYVMTLRSSGSATGRVPYLTVSQQRTRDHPGRSFQLPHGLL